MYPNTYSLKIFYIDWQSYHFVEYRKKIYYNFLVIKGKQSLGRYRL